MRKTGSFGSGFHAVLRQPTNTQKGREHMQIVGLVFAALLPLCVIALFFLLCRKRKHGRAVFVCLTLWFMAGMIRYETTQGSLRTFADLDDAYHADYTGEIRLVIDGNKTKLLVGVDDNAVQCYVVVRQNRNGAWRIVLGDDTKLLWMQNGVMVQQITGGLSGERYLTVSCPTQTMIEPDVFSWLETQSLPEYKSGYAYVQPEEREPYTLTINGERMEWKL